MGDHTLGKRSGKLSRDVTAKHLAPWIKVAVRSRRAGIIGYGITVRDSSREMALIAGEEAHLYGRNVDAMRSVSRIIGQSPAQTQARLEHQNPRGDMILREMVGDPRAGKAATNDGDRLESWRTHHRAIPWGRAVKLRSIMGAYSWGRSCI